MYKSLLTLSFFFVCGILYSQDGILVNFCGKENSQLTFKELSDCGKLVANDSNWTVASFVVGYVAKGVYYEKSFRGPILDTEMLKSWKQHQVGEIYFERILVENKTGDVERCGMLKLEMAY